MGIKEGITWALEMCKRETVYSQATRNRNECNGYTGSPQYFDCTSFCAGYAYKAGFMPIYLVNGNNTWYTGDAGFWLKKYGFRALNIRTEPVQQGDIIIRNFGGNQDHGEVVYQNPSNAPALSDAYQTIGTGGSSPHSIIIQSSNFGSTPCNEAYRPINGGEFLPNGYGWSFNAFCALLGNLERESQLNPGQIEAPYTVESPIKGLGLFQWTEEWSKPYQNPILKLAQKFGKNWYDGFFQCEVINNADNAEYLSPEDWGWIHATGMRTLAEFKISSLSIPELTEIWMRNVERPGIPELSERIANAQKWAAFLSGKDPSLGNSLSFKYEIKNNYIPLPAADIENNVLCMYSIFCGSGNPGSGIIQPDWWYFQRKSAWNIIYAMKPRIRRL